MSAYRTRPYDKCYWCSNGIVSVAWCSSSYLRQQNLTRVLLTCRQWQDVYTLPIPEQQLLGVDEQLLRNWAAAAGQLQIHVTVNAPPDNSNSNKKAASSPPAKGAAAAAAAAPPPVAYGALKLNCAGLLVGDTAATYGWTQSCTNTSSAAAQAVGVGTTLGTTQASIELNQSGVPAVSKCKKSKSVIQPPSGTLASWLGSAEVQLHVYKAPAPETAADPKAAAGQQNSGSCSTAAATGGWASKTATAATAGPVLEPCSLLTPEQAAVYNPVVVFVYKAANLPDAPATPQQLDQQCEQIKLKALWAPLVSAAQHVQDAR